MVSIWNLVDEIIDIDYWSFSKFTYDDSKRTINLELLGAKKQNLPFGKKLTTSLFYNIDE